MELSVVVDILRTRAHEQVAEVTKPIDDAHGGSSLCRRPWDDV